MRERKTRLSSSARRWFLEEVEYLAARSVAAASQFVDRIEAARLTIADHNGAPQKGEIPGTGRYVVGKYILTITMKNGVPQIASIRSAQQGDAYKPDDLEFEPDEPSTPRFR